MHLSNAHFASSPQYDFHGAWDTTVNFQTPWRDPLVRGFCVHTYHYKKGRWCVLPGWMPAALLPPHTHCASPRLSQGGSLDIATSLDHFINKGQVPPRWVGGALQNASP